MHVVLPAEIYEALRDRAHREHRSMASLIIEALTPSQAPVTREAPPRTEVIAQAQDRGIVSRLIEGRG